MEEKGLLLHTRVSRQGGWRANLELHVSIYMILPETDLCSNLK